MSNLYDVIDTYNVTKWTVEGVNSPIVVDNLEIVPIIGLIKIMLSDVATEEVIDLVNRITVLKTWDPVLIDAFVGEISNRLTDEGYVISALYTSDDEEVTVNVQLGAQEEFPFLGHRYSIIDDEDAERYSSFHVTELLFDSPNGIAHLIWDIALFKKGKASVVLYDGEVAITKIYNDEFSVDIPVVIPENVKKEYFELTLPTPLIYEDIHDLMGALRVIETVEY